MSRSQSVGGSGLLNDPRLWSTYDGSLCQTLQAMGQVSSGATEQIPNPTDVREFVACASE